MMQEWLLFLFPILHKKYSYDLNCRHFITLARVKFLLLHSVRIVYWHYLITLLLSHFTLYIMSQRCPIPLYFFSKYFFMWWPCAFFVLNNLHEMSFQAEIMPSVEHLLAIAEIQVWHLKLEDIQFHLIQLHHPPDQRLRYTLSLTVKQLDRPLCLIAGSQWLLSFNWLKMFMFNLIEIFLWVWARLHFSSISKQC